MPERVQTPLLGLTSTVRQILAKTDSLHERAGIPVTLRRLSRSGHFAKGIDCFPSCVTVICEHRRSKPFRHALTSRHGRKMIDMRSCTREILSSEIHLAAITDYPSQSATVSAGLGLTGVPDALIGPLLRSADLHYLLERAPHELLKYEVRVLSLISALYSKVKIVVFDDPFSSLPPSVTEKIAATMLEIVRASDRVVIVTGIEQIPQVWRNARSVEIAEPEARRARTFSLNSAKADVDEAMVQVRALLQVTAREGVEEKPKVVTYPQSVSPSDVALRAPEQVLSEKIPNRSIAVSNDWELQTTAEVTPIRRKRKDSLTRVTAANRLLHQSKLASLWSSFRAGTAQRVRAVRSGDPVLANDRVRYAKRQTELKGFLAVIVSLDLFLLIMWAWS